MQTSSFKARGVTPRAFSLACIWLLPNTVEAMFNAGTRLLATIFLLMQAVGAAIWWLLILFNPASHEYLLPNGVAIGEFAILLPADALLFIGGSVAAAAAIWREARSALIVLAIHTGAALYAAMYAWAAAVKTGGGWVSAWLMVPTILVLPTLVVSMWRRMDHAR